MKVCPQCKSELKHSLEEKESIWGSQKLIVTNTPTISCTCGEVFYSTKVVSKLQKLAINYGVLSGKPQKVDFEKEVPKFNSIGGINHDN